MANGPKKGTTAVNIAPPTKAALRALGNVSQLSK